MEDRLRRDEESIRLAWRIARFAEAADLSVPFVRKEIRNGNLKAHRRGGAIYILDEDARAYLRTGEVCRPALADAGANNGRGNLA